MTDVSPTRVYPPGRYGRRRSPRRRRVLGVLPMLAAVALALLVAVVLYQRYGGRPEGTVERISDVTGSAVTVSLRVQQPGGRPATCQLQALDRNHAEVGYAQVAIPAGRDVRVSYTLATTAKPVAVAVLGCRTR